MIALSTIGSWAFIIYLLAGIGYIIHRFVGDNQ